MAQRRRSRIRRLNVIKLTYTEQMKENDKLWETESEDLDLMLKLYDDILKEAISKGFDQLYYSHIANDEAVIELYNDEKEYINGHEEPEMFGYCKPLIKYIESVLNKKENIMITPEELRERAKKLKFNQDMENALRQVDKDIEKALNSGDIRVMVNGWVELGNLFYYDDKQNAIAKELMGRGFKCKRESDIVDGARQHPSWYIYIV